MRKGSVDQIAGFIYLLKRVIGLCEMIVNNSLHGINRVEDRVIYHC